MAVAKVSSPYVVGVIDAGEEDQGECCLGGVEAPGSAD